MSAVAIQSLWVVRAERWKTEWQPPSHERWQEKLRDPALVEFFCALLDIGGRLRAMASAMLKNIANYTIADDAGHNIVNILKDGNSFFPTIFEFTNIRINSIIIYPKPQPASGYKR